MSSKPLSNVDTAWLRMEDPANLMMITGLIIFDGPMYYERLQEVIRTRLLRHERFKQRVVPPRLPLERPSWEDDPRFDILAHLKRITLPVRGSQAVLQELVSQLMSTQLDFSRPLWQFHLVEDFDNRGILIARLHHCIADGISLVHVLLSLADPAQPATQSPGVQVQPGGAPLWKPSGILSRLIRPVNHAIRRTGRITEVLLHEGMEALVYPPYARDLARLGTDSAASLARLVLRWPDPPTVFKGPLGIPKRAAWSEPVSLDDVKAVGKSMHGTVNDVVLTAVTGALRTYLQGRGQPVDDLNFRAAVPVNLRPLHIDQELGNRFGLVFLSLPVCIADPQKRLYELKRRMDVIKRSQEAVVSFGILNSIGIAPSEIQDIVVNIFGTKATAVMTNVPGPRDKLTMAGVPIQTLMAWVPQSGRLGLGVSIISYAGKVWLGVATDQGLAPDPEKIIAAFHAEFDALCASTRACTPRPGSLKALLKDLDEIDRSLDELQAGRSSPASIEGIVKTALAPPVCLAQTKSGLPCKNKPLPGQDFCHTHLVSRQTRRQQTAAN